MKRDHPKSTDAIFFQCLFSQISTFCFLSVGLLALKGQPLRSVCELIVQIYLAGPLPRLSTVQPPICVHGDVSKPLQVIISVLCRMFVHVYMCLYMHAYVCICTCACVYICFKASSCLAPTTVFTHHLLCLAWLPSNHVLYFLQGRYHLPLR